MPSSGLRIRRFGPATLHLVRARGSGRETAAPGCASAVELQGNPVRRREVVRVERVRVGRSGSSGRPRAFGSSDGFRAMTPGTEARVATREGEPQITTNGSHEWMRRTVARRGATRGRAVSIAFG